MQTGEEGEDNYVAYACRGMKRKHFTSAIGSKVSRRVRGHMHSITVEDVNTHNVASQRPGQGE